LECIRDVEGTTIRFIDLLKKINSGGSEMNESDLKEIVEVLCGEEEISCRGKTNGEKVIMKR
jgi:hypothetical protein